MKSSLSTLSVEHSAFEQFSELREVQRDTFIRGCKLLQNLSPARRTHSQREYNRFSGGLRDGEREAEDGRVEFGQREEDSKYGTGREISCYKFKLI